MVQRWTTPVQSTALTHPDSRHAVPSAVRVQYRYKSRTPVDEGMCGCMHGALSAWALTASCHCSLSIRLHVRTQVVPLPLFEIRHRLIYHRMSAWQNGGSTWSVCPRFPGPAGTTIIASDQRASATITDATGLTDPASDYGQADRCRQSL